MDLKERETKLQEHYESIGALKDDRVTAFDGHLRDLEIAYGTSHLSSDQTVLDVGCGGGVACFTYATQAKQVTGIDFSQSMIDFANDKKSHAPLNIREKLTFQQASALELPFEDNTFDVITTHRVLIALLSWGTQRKALSEIKRCLKGGGRFLMFEATEEGLETLNQYRQLFGLEEVEKGGRGDYDRLLFSEKKLKDFMHPHFELETIHTFGMYYFLTRILQPLYVAPDQPRYDHPLNTTAFEIAKKLPDFHDLGHLKGFVWKKKDN